MSDHPEAANDGDKKHKTVAEQALDAFYIELEKKEGFSEIAVRFRNESGRSEKAIRQVLFGDDS